MTTQLIKINPCPKCGGHVYRDKTFGLDRNICSECGRSHEMGAIRDSIDRQMGNYKEKKRDDNSETVKEASVPFDRSIRTRRSRNASRKQRGDQA